MTMKEDEFRVVLARLIYDALEECSPSAYLGEFSLDRPVSIDGKFNFREVAEALETSLRSNSRKHSET